MTGVKRLDNVAILQNSGPSFIFNAITIRYDMVTCDQKLKKWPA